MVAALAAGVVFHRRRLNVDEKSIPLSVLCVSSESRDSGMKRAMNIYSLTYSHSKAQTTSQAGGLRC